MGIEGHLRDLALGEVLQLLAAGRKTGVLNVSAPLEGRSVVISVNDGRVTDVAGLASPVGAASGGGEYLRRMEEQLLAVLEWRDGTFQFAAHPGSLGDVPPTDAHAASTGDTVREQTTVSSPAPSAAAQHGIQIDALLMESARRSDVWAQLAPHVTDAGMIPDFPVVGSQELSLLHLTPSQWEILTCVDGRRSLSDLALVLNQDVVDVAVMVHGLIEAGVLKAKGHPTAAATMPAPDDTPVGIPPVYFAAPLPAVHGEVTDDDSLFDPMQVGVMGADGMPAVLEQGNDVTPVAARVTIPDHAPAPLAGDADTMGGIPSHAEENRVDLAVLVQAADEAARAGRLAEACIIWRQCLHSGELPAYMTGGIRERLELTERLLTVLGQ